MPWQQARLRRTIPLRFADAVWCAEGAIMTEGSRRPYPEFFEQLEAARCLIDRASALLTRAQAEVEDHSVRAYLQETVRELRTQLEANVAALEAAGRALHD